eukprot:SAG11_NODE_2177_length_3716_cov_2.968482_4_plen_157_part_00
MAATLDAREKASPSREASHGLPLDELCVKQVIDELCCPVCLDWLTDAVETNCAHAFCCECLLGVLEAAAPAGGSLVTARRAPQCPSCRTPVVLARPAVVLRRVVRAARGLVLSTQSAAGHRGSAAALRRRFREGHRDSDSVEVSGELDWSGSLRSF